MSVENAHNRGRGRGRGRGNRGKYLRALGRRGLGRGAEFNPRLLLEEEQEDSDNDEDDQEDRYAKREIVDNGDKYVEPEVEPNEVEEDPEPEVDLSVFLAKQQIKDTEELFSHPPDPDQEDIDYTLSNLTTSSKSLKPRKNNIQTIQWDASMEKLKKEKEAADAVRGLKARFITSHSRPIRSQARGQSEKIAKKTQDLRHEGIPIEDIPHPSSSKAQMEDFLDDLLS